MTLLVPTVFLSLCAPRFATADERFPTSASCLACHNRLTGPAGEDLSIGTGWRGTMMSNAARDPYWQAAVRREVTDHPTFAAAIENECAICHMPLASHPARGAGGQAGVLSVLPPRPVPDPNAAVFAASVDGVSCTACHQAEDDGLGSAQTMSGRFVVDLASPAGRRKAFGPFAVDAGRARVMRSATGFVPTEGAHMASAGICASCHTLYTHPVGEGVPEGSVLPEQVPYLEWKASEHAEEQSCQGCHMVEVRGASHIASVMGQDRTGVRRHDIQGANVTVPGMLNLERADLQVASTPSELVAATDRAGRFLANEAARIEIVDASGPQDTIAFDVTVQNLTGHKLPTAYPSRRVWLHVSVEDASGAVVFVSGALGEGGAIRGNDNDADATRYEPHYAEIASADQVQIYEPILADAKGAVTTGLLSAVRYIKDNRLLPRGFDKQRAGADIAVRGTALEDPDFAGGSDRVRYRIPAGTATGPFRVVATLDYQPIGFRWAMNLAQIDTPETGRFGRLFRAIAPASTATLSRATATIGVRGSACVP